MALLADTGAYRTTSTDALCVLAGQLPIRLAVMERHYSYILRKGIRFSVEGDVFNGDHSISMKTKLRAAMTRQWQREWDKSEKGKITRVFFPDIARRLKMNWMLTNHYTNQFLTGQGDFKWKLR